MRYEITYKVIPNVRQEHGSIIGEFMQFIGIHLALLCKPFQISVTIMVQGHYKVKYTIRFWGHLSENDPGAAPRSSVPYL